jgi:hypothetical protein
LLAELVRRGWLEEDAAAAMLTWPHSGFGAYLGPSIADRAGVLRVARHAARAAVAESRLRYDAERAEVELVSDRRRHDTKVPGSSATRRGCSRCGCGGATTVPTPGSTG